MNLTVTPLGSNGFVPTFGRQTMSFLVEGGERPLLLDAGSGVGRLVGGPLANRLDGHDHLEILLTHYHLDHTIGLSYLPACAAGKRVTLHVPGPPLVDADGRQALGRLLAPPLFPLTLDAFPAEVEVRPYGGEPLRIAGLDARLRRQRHGGGSVGVVLGDRLAYLTDCEPEEASIDFVRGVPLLLHEVWVSDEEAAAGRHRAGHSTVEEVAEIARRAAVGALLPVHHYPGRDAAGVRGFRDRLAELSGVEVLAGEEGKSYHAG